MKLHRTLLLVVILICMTNHVTAQNGVNSPYSRYGLGMQSDHALGFNKAMSGVALGFRDGQSINVANPASYSAVDSLTAIFDLGLTLQNGNYKMGGVQQNRRNTSFDYFAFHFRARPHLGIALGILPYTKINYSFTSSSNLLEGTENTTTSYAFNGTGGVHQLFIGAGWQPFNRLSIGANLSFLYGDYRHTATMSFNSTTIYSPMRGYTADISTYKLDFGAQYTHPITPKDQLTIGFTYGLGHDINNRAVRFTRTINSSSAVQTDTTETIHKAFQLPHSFAAGLAWNHNNRWIVGIDATWDKWSNCRFPAQEDDTYQSTTGQLNDHLRLAIGASFTPNTESRRYFSRITYKAGAYCAQPYAKTDAADLQTDKPLEFGVSAGFTLPIQNRNLWRSSPKINVAFQWVHTSIPYVGNTSHRQEKLTENYLRLSLGLTFSERWFYKWKVQ